MPESNVMGSLSVMNMIPAGAGRVFVVGQAGTDTYSFYQDLIGFNAPTDRIQLVSCTAAAADVAINSALTSCVDNRNDYVVLLPSTSDYDLTAALTMTKKSSHLVCLPDMNRKGLGNSVRVHQTTASLANVVVTADNVEIAGIFFKQYDSTGYDSPAIIHLSGTRWTPHIHDNFFGCSASNATKPTGILADGACSHFNIHNNYFTNYAPALTTGTNNTIDAFIKISKTSSTRGRIADNIIHTGCNTTVDTGINCQAAYAVIDNNTLVADKAVGAADAGVMTIGITGVVSSSCKRNTFHGVAGAFSGTTNDSSDVLNYDATNGGTLTDEDIG